MSQDRFMGNIIGRLGKDPNLGVTKAGRKICKFSLAINERDGEVEICTWMAVTAFDKQAELCQQYLRKGIQVDIIGKVKLRQYTGRDGTPKQENGITVEHISWFERKEVVDEPQPPTAADQDPNPVFNPITDDDIPF